MKRKHITIPQDTRVVIDTPAGNRLTLYRHQGSLIVNTENLVPLREVVASGDVMLQGIPDTEPLKECLRDSLQWLGDMAHHLTPAQQVKLSKHLEICNITLKP